MPPTLELSDRLSSLTCLLFVLTLFIAAPLVGVGESRVTVAMRHEQGAALVTAPTPLAAQEHVPLAASAPSVVPTAARTPAFVCVDFVCVNRSGAVPNLFDYSPAAVTRLRHFESFGSCVEQCVASKPRAGAAFASRGTARQPSTAAAAPSAAQPSAATPATSVASAVASAFAAASSATPPAIPTGTGLVHVGNRSLDAALTAWLAARHDAAPCDASTPVYFAPFSPNGIGNKVLAAVMAFHMSLMQGKRLVVSDWPPLTLDVSYPLAELLKPSSCQALFDNDRQRPRVKKCTVISCPLHTRSIFRNGYTQPHWAHMSASFLDLPKEWAHLEWLDWWRAITQYLFRPGSKLLAGMSKTLERVQLLRSPGSASAKGGAEQLHQLR